MNNDLISRSALKKWIDESVRLYGNQYSSDMLNMFGLFREIINNAPTVKLTEEQAIDKLHETGWLIRHDKEMTERPQGEWIKWNFRTFGPLGDWDYKCSNCEKVYYGEYNYCPNCGAEMKGGETNG